MASIQPCDHTSVGILVVQNGKLLLIDRKRPPLGLAAPAGHVDKHGKAGQTEEERYAAAAIAELKEETGLDVEDLMLHAEERMENPCRRPNGTWHYWRIYTALATGELKPSTAETRSAFWCTRSQMADLLASKRILMQNGQKAGLEPVWLEWFAGLGVIRWLND